MPLTNSVAFVPVFMLLLAVGPSVAAVEPDGIRVTKIAVTIDRGDGGFDIDAFVEERLDSIRLPRERVKTKVVRSGDVVKAILEEAEKHDLIVLGSTRQPLLYQFAREAVPETVAKLCEKPMVMVRASRGIRSWLRRWI